MGVGLLLFGEQIIFFIIDPARPYLKGEQIFQWQTYFP